jgi:hypothetical protein
MLFCRVFFPQDLDSAADALLSGHLDSQWTSSGFTW